MFSIKLVAYKEALDFASYAALPVELHLLLQRGRFWTQALLRSYLSCLVWLRGTFCWGCSALKYAPCTWEVVSGKWAPVL